MREIENIAGYFITRRKFLKVGAISTAGVLTGCATNPVTGDSQLMLISEQQEVSLDKTNSPHQFSADYGTSTDTALNKYISDTGMGMASISHRPAMPYSFQVVNANYINAYAFPGGSIACTRGIMVALDNEAELAALLGHEIGHVNARHTASRMSSGLLVQLAVVGLTAYAASRDRRYTDLAAGLGGIGAGLLLARYSRSDERQADALGMEYMTKAGHTPQGMVGLMEMLQSQHKRQPSSLEMMFSTHPMSQERYSTALSRVDGPYAEHKSLPDNKERYMDNTASLRAIKGAIEKMQQGEKAMMKKKYPEAEGHFAAALKEAPNDYAANVLMAKCQMAMGKHDKAKKYAEKAKAINPKEAQAHHVAGISKLMRHQYSSAHQDFAAYENLLPGNPNTIFFKAVSLEGMGKKQSAAREYNRYLQKDRQSQQAKFAYNRLVQWGYVQPQQQQPQRAR